MSTYYYALRAPVTHLAIEPPSTSRTKPAWVNITISVNHQLVGLLTAPESDASEFLQIFFEAEPSAFTTNGILHGHQRDITRWDTDTILLSEYGDLTTLGALRKKNKGLWYLYNVRIAIELLISNVTIFCPDYGWAALSSIFILIAIAVVQQQESIFLGAEMKAKLKCINCNSAANELYQRYSDMKWVCIECMPKEQLTKYKGYTYANKISKHDKDRANRWRFGWLSDMH